jgi:ribosomal protein L17
METDTILFAEGDADADCRHIEYADAGILTYDKLHKTDIPTFEEGEAAVMTRYAENAESSRAFIEIPSFAYSMVKYVDKSEAIRITDKRQSELRYDAERMIITAKYGKGGDREIIYESLENTKAKLELVSELGFMGISFDIGRVCIPDLMIAASMFDVISYPVMTPRVNQDI